VPDAALEGADAAISTPQSKGGEGGHDSDTPSHDDEVAALPSAALPMGASPFDAPQGVMPAAPPPAYSSLPTGVAELFDRMVGLLTLQNHKGVSTTTVTLSMPGSLFDGAELVLDHYSTAPSEFYIELQGSPEAVDLFAAHMSELAAAFAERPLPYQVTLRSPILQQRYRVNESRGKGSDKEKG
jgi:hypothetical protein